MVSSETFDAVIVGAFFSGITAAEAASKSEKVLLIEKRKLTRTPVNTTGTVLTERLSRMNAYRSNDFITEKIKCVQLIDPNDEIAVLKKSESDRIFQYPLIVM